MCNITTALSKETPLSNWLLIGRTTLTPTNAYVYFNSSVLIPKVFIYDLRGTLVQVMENTDPETKQKN